MNTFEDLKIKVMMDTSEVDKAVKKVNKSMKGFLDPNVFQGWAMSLMFAGQAIKRTATEIYKFGTKTFQEISHSVEGTVTNTDRLEGSMKYLGFTIGSALEPVVAFLIPIVDKLAEWVEKNPEIAKFGIITLLVTGAILAFSGALVLATTNGLIPLINGMKALSSTILITKGALAGLTIGGLLGFLGIIGGIILVINWIIKLKNELGGWGEFFKSVARGILRVITVLAEAFAWFGNLLINMLITPLNLIIKLINSITQSKFVKETLGINVGKIGTVNTDYEWGDAVLGKYLNWEQNSALAQNQQQAPTYNINIEKIETNDMDSLMNQLKQYSTTG